MRVCRHPQRTLTPPELVLCAAVIALGLLAVAGWYDHALNRAKVRQMSALLEALQRAASAYAETRGAYPPGRGDMACDPALAVMQTVPASATHLQVAQSHLLFLTDGKLRCTDPWGRPVRYLTGRSERPDARRRVEANGGIPIFESAGPDRDFGDADPVGQADNLCGDDPAEGPVQLPQPVRRGSSG